MAWRDNNGNDTIKGGGSGNDLLLGGGGADYIRGNSGNDYIDVGDDNDYIRGESGNDCILGGSGNDMLKGESGNDTIDGGAGNDYMSGGTGSDTFIIGDNSGNDRIADFCISEDKLIIQERDNDGSFVEGDDFLIANDASGNAVITILNDGVDTGDNVTLDGVDADDLDGFFTIV